MSPTTPLLTVAIPTWNRARFLEAGLQQLLAEFGTIPPGLVEVLVSDNASSDETPGVVQQAIDAGLPVQYLRNPENVGYELNFVQCFERSRGNYLVVMADDDLFVDGALAKLVACLTRKQYGVVCLRPYGFDKDFRHEHPGGRGREVEYDDANSFLVAINRYFTLISACVINKSLLVGVSPRQFLDCYITAFHLVLRAALAADANLFVDEYLVASKRQNSFDYDYAKVFVDDLWKIIDAHVIYGLRPETVKTLERDKMLAYYPFYLFDLRRAARGDVRVAHARFARRFRGRWLFRYWLEPTLVWPLPLALIWGAGTTAVGRVMVGDLRRGLIFVWRRLGQPFRRRSATAPLARAHQS